MEDLNGAGFLLRRRNEKNKDVYLLLKARWGGHWSFPKGHIEKGESPLKAALRETYEETGITEDLIQIESIPERDVSYKLEKKTKKVKDGIKRIRVYFGFLKTKPVVNLSREHIDFRWGSLNTCTELLRPELADLVKIHDETNNDLL